MRSMSGVTQERTGRGRGFTLVEVLVALGLVVALAAGMYGFVTSMHTRQARISEETSRSGGVSAFFDQLESDLLTCVARDARLGGGVRGNADSLTVVSRGVGVSSDAALTDARATEYRFAGGMIMASRRESSGGGQGQPICPGVEKLRFRYYDGTSWRDSFDSAQAGTLPVAIEAAVWFVGNGPATDESRAESPSSATAKNEDSTAVGPDEIEKFEPESFEDPEEAAARPADRVRLIVVPDGPVSNLKSSEPS